MPDYDMTKHMCVALLSILAVVSCGRCTAVEADAVLSRVPAGDSASREALCADLLSLGADGVKTIVSQLVQPGPGTGDDTKARMALHALVMHVSHSPDAAHRTTVVTALLEALSSAKTTAAKRFILQQLEFIGGRESVAGVAAFLEDSELADVAIRTLLALRADGVAGALRGAYSGASPERRAALALALGRLRDQEAVDMLLPDAGTSDETLRRAVLYGLAGTGSPRAVPALQKALEVQSWYARSRAAEFYLLLIRRMAETGERDKALSLCREFMDDHKSDVHLQCAALETLISIRGADGFDELLAAIRNDDLQIRTSARRLGVALKGEAATRRWIGEFEKSNGTERLEILRVLVDRADRAAIATFMAAIKDPDEAVRVAGLDGLGRVADESVVPVLIGAMSRGSEKERIQAALSLRRLPDEVVIATIEKALPEADAEGRAGLVKVLATRKATLVLPMLFNTAVDKSAAVRRESFVALGSLVDSQRLARLIALTMKAASSVRPIAESAVVAACKRIGEGDVRTAPVLAALNGADVSARVSLLRILGRLGGSKAYEAVTAALDADEAKVKDAAVRSLADWPDATPSDLLLRLANTNPNQVHAILAFRGYVKMIGMPSDRSHDATLDLYEGALGAAKRPDEKMLVLSGIARVPTLRALRMAESCFADPALKEEAASAYLEVAIGVSCTEREAARAALKRIPELSESQLLRDRAAQALALLERCDAYLTNWVISGPYKTNNRGRDNIQSLHKIGFPPEDPEAKDVAWERVGTFSRPSSPWITDFNALIKETNCCAYARTLVHVPAKQKALLIAGSDDGIKVWLNGKVVHEKNVPRGLKVDEDTAEVELAEGWNTLMLKITQGGGGWEFCAKLATPDKKPIPELRSKAE